MGGIVSSIFGSSEPEPVFSQPTPPRISTPTRYYNYNDHTAQPQPTVAPRVLTPSYRASNYSYTTTDGGLNSQRAQPRASSVVHHRAPGSFSLDDLQILKRIAEDFLSGQRMHGTRWLSRNGPEHYLNYTVMVQQKGIMDCRLKDISGHKQNPINKRISGIFFLANVERNGEPKFYSPFGPRRIMIPAFELLKGCNLYFADFYCLKLGKTHYVQIVATIPGSACDKMCRSWLPPLDGESNMFLRIDLMNQTVCFKSGALIEVMYTRNIDVNLWLKRGGKFCDVPSSGVKSLKGLVKCRDCTICDL